MRGVRLAGLAVPAAAAAVAGLIAFAAPSGRAASEDDLLLGAELYVAQCAACHGVDGTGVEDRGPPLTDEGPAAVDFVLRTGRMPMPHPWMQPRRGPPRFTEEQIVSLVEHAGAFGDGPAIPEVDVTGADLTAGGRLYQLNCAACHVASGAGAAIGGGREAPDLTQSSPTEIGEAIRIGPGAMPVFDSFTDDDIDAVAAYILHLKEEETTAPRDFGGAGPVAEGLAAWLLALVPLVALTRWIGTPHEGRDSPVDPAEPTPAATPSEGPPS
jgi:ubiquinol-cytochrome c reductase cytochrome c subunit